MKYFLLIPLFYAAACGSSSEKSNHVIIDNQKPQDKPVSEIIISEPTNTEPVISEPVTPAGSVEGSFKPNQLAFYAYVKSVNKLKGVTTIAFENSKAPSLILTNTYAATLSKLSFDTFSSDLLLVDTKIDDPQFHKFHLYVLKNGSWQPVVNPFSLHESHISQVQNPIVVDPNNPNNMFRYYSVFDIDETNTLGYGWRIHNESVSVLNR